MDLFQRCLALRFLGLFVWLILLLDPMASVGASTEDLVLARVEVIGMLNELELPVYAHLQGTDETDYALVIASLSQLNATGVAYTVLHAPDMASSEKKYLIALERVSGARQQAASLMSILHDDGRQIIVYTSSSQAQVLAELGFEIEWLSDTPLILDQTKAMLLAQFIGYDSTVAEIINMVEQDKVQAYCGNLSGDNAVQIGGIDYNIHSRNTDNDVWIERATQYIYEFMQAQGLPVAYHFWSGSSRNVFAEKLGTTHPDEIVLIAAHLDCMPSSGRAPGADDNASGSVGVMLAAELLKAFNFERTIRYVFFTGEEQGLLGSDAYAQKVYDDGDNIVAVYNMDMIAWDDVGLPVLRLHTRTTTNPGYAGDKAIADMFVNVVNIYGMDSDLTPVIDADGISASDHSSFWSRGYSAILAVEDDESDFNEYYHTVNDSLDKLNMEYFTSVVKASLGTVAHLASPANQGLNPKFSYAAEFLTVKFTDTSTCTDCTVVAWDWDFGDGGSSSAQNPAHTYALAGTYPVSLTVTDDGGMKGTASSDVSVGDAPTPTPTPTLTPTGTATGTPSLTVTETPTPVRKLLGVVDLQGRPTPPDARWSVELTVSLTPVGGSTPTFNCSPLTDQTGAFECVGFTPGSYVVCVKHSHTLQNCVQVTLASGLNNVDFGTLLEGDVDDDNCVVLVDFSMLASTFGLCSGEPGFDARADLDVNDCIQLLDFSLLASNFAECGDDPGTVDP
jgi:PKD repeat protein